MFYKREQKIEKLKKIQVEDLTTGMAALEPALQVYSTAL
jgi:hypothetical protein